MLRMSTAARARRAPPALLTSFLASLSALLLAGGCTSADSRAPQDITRGVWAGTAGGDTFLFDLRGTPPDSLTGAVHVMREGRMDSELGITRASYRAPDLELYIASTDATYTGRVDIPGGRITGGLTFGDNEGPEMELRWMDPSDLPGFAALPGDGPYRYRRPEEGIDGWPTATPEEVDLDRGAVEALVQAVADDQAGLIHSLHVVRRGRLVLDEYFHGYGPADLHRLASTTKSVASLLVGAAMDRGLIAGVDVPLVELLGEPTATGPGWEGETLRHLLTMSMGLDWRPAEREGVHGTGPAFFRRVLEREVVEDPGSTWDYVSANVDLLAGVIFEATGEHADAFARRVLFEPLGIDVFNWEY
ncbi:MAG: serine hydrolase, partial [Gemmatimonadota bacterium]